jgi:AsmA protein
VRRLLSALFAVFALLVVATVAAPLLVPLETWKAQIVQRTKAATGRDLRIDGAIRLAFLPRLRLELDKVGLSGAPGARNGELLRLDRLQLVIGVLPLLSGRLDVESIELERPLISLEIDDKGRTNWDLSTAGHATTDSAGASEDTDWLSSFDVARLKIDDGAVSCTDRRDGSSWQATGVDLALSLKSFDAPLDVDGSVVWQAKKISVDAAVASPRNLFDGGRSGVRARIKGEPLDFRFDGDVVSGQGMKAMQASGSIDLGAASLRDAAAWLGYPMHNDSHAFGPLRIRGTLDERGSIVELADAHIDLDALSASGSVRIDVGGTRPRFEGKLDARPLDLNPYLPAEAVMANDSPDASTGWSDAPLDFSALGAVDADLDLLFGDLRLRKTHIDDGSGRVHWKDARLTASLANLALYGGGGSGTVILDGVRPSQPSMDVALDLKEVQSAPLLSDIAAFDAISGTGSVALHVSTRGASQREMIQSLAGSGELHLRDGAIRGINMAGVVRRTTDALTGHRDRDSTAFSRLDGTVQSVRGVIRNDDMLLDSPQVKIAGSGSIDLPRHAIDYRISPKWVAPLVGEIGFGSPGLAVPVFIRGPFDDVRFEPDLAGLITEGPRALIRGARDLTQIPGALIGLGRQEQDSDATTQEDDSHKSHGKIGKTLKGLFGR